MHVYCDTKHPRTWIIEVLGVYDDSYIVFQLTKQTNSLTNRFENDNESESKTKK